MQYKLLPTVNMKYIKYCSIFFIITLLTTVGSNAKEQSFSNTVSPVNNMKLSTTSEKISSNKPLSEDELKTLFPDANFRNVITRNFKHQEITLDKIADLSGEFYATGENISSLKGISYLKGIEDFVFWNNNIKVVPKEILKLNNIKSINLANNYITDDEVIDALKAKNIDVNYDLNFIKNKQNQYKLSSYYRDVTLDKGEQISINKLLYKNIKSYDKYWEVSDEISKNIKYMVSIDNTKVINLEDKFHIRAVSPGTSIIKISLDDNFYDKSTAIIKIKVKN